MGKAKSALRSQEEALRRACRFADRAREAAARAGLELVAAYLVGSRARGDYTEESDVDVVLVVKGAGRLNALQRAEVFADVLEPGMELFVYAPEEWERGGAWIGELKKEAVPLAALCARYLDGSATWPMK